MRLLEHYNINKNNKNENLPQLQGIIGNFFNGINTRLQRTKKALLTRQRIAALIVCASNEMQCNEGTRKDYWKIRSKTLKKEITEKKKKQPKVAGNEELAALTLEANTANIAIHAVKQIYRTYDGENPLRTSKRTHRRQLRASHLELLEELNNINEELRTRNNNQLEW